jgi:nucleoside-diphosphate-sugar epimerase
MKTVCVTGSQGFLGGYICRHLLENDYRVIGIDNYSKYGKVARDYDNHPYFRFVEMDLTGMYAVVKLFNVLKRYSVKYLIAGAAMVGGIKYFHDRAYDLLATNERIAANTFDAAIKAYKESALEKVVVISSSMVYEGADAHLEHLQYISNDNSVDDKVYQSALHKSIWPSHEWQTKQFPPPYSTYGFSKLAIEYFAEGAHTQYGLDYGIVRPFNAVGLGEEESPNEPEVQSGNIKLRMSHVLPDLVVKCLRGQNPLRLYGDGQQVRCFTHGKDIARGVAAVMEHRGKINRAFNISVARKTSILELAEMVWREVHGSAVPFAWESEKPFEHDVQVRLPSVELAANELGWKADISLEETVKEVVEYFRRLHNGQHA